MWITITAAKLAYGNRFPQLKEGNNQTSEKYFNFLRALPQFDKVGRQWQKYPFTSVAVRLLLSLNVENVFQI